MKKSSRCFLFSALLLLLFVLFTVAVKTVDVQPIGPNGSSVGFAAVNVAMFSLFGESEFWYRLTGILGYLAILIMVGFAALGAWELVKRRSLKKVDADLISLGVLLVLTLVCYALFEVLKINFRPVLTDGELEASYPSSHTMFVLVAMCACAHELTCRRVRMPLRALGYTAAGAVMALTSLGRLFSGAHWLTDVLGAILLSAALVFFYRGFERRLIGRRNREHKRRAKAER